LLTDTRDADSDVELNFPTKSAEYIYAIKKETDSKKKEKKTEKVTVATVQDKVDDKEDYHGNINGPLWIKWLHNRLIPAFKAKYPWQGMILVMDGAAYHHPHDVDWVSVSAMNKPALIDAFKKYDIKTFDIDRDSKKVTFTTADLVSGARGGATVPTNLELKAYLNQYLKDNPHLTKTLTQKAMDSIGGRIIHTPPYEPRCQPIEELWGVVKGNVASQYSLGRTVEDTRQQLLSAFYKHKYGVGVNAQRGRSQDEVGVTSEMVNGMINRCKDWMNRWIVDNPAWLVGNQESLIKRIDVEGPELDQHETVTPDDWADKVEDVDNVVDAMADQMEEADVAQKVYDLRTDDDCSADQMVALNMLMNKLPSDGKLKNLVLNNGEDRMEEAEEEEKKTISCISSINDNFAIVKRYLNL
jgi:hypothetical protein